MPEKHGDVDDKVPHRFIGQQHSCHDGQVASLGADKRHEHQHDATSSAGLDEVDGDVRVCKKEVKRKMQEDRRKHNNTLRRARFRAGKRARTDERKAALASLTEEERKAEGELAKERRRQHAELGKLQLQRVQAAMAGEGSSLRIAVECSFPDTTTNDKLIRSLCKQLEMAMGFNKRSEKPAALLVGGFSGRVAEIANGMAAGNWKALKFDKPIGEVFPPAEVVVLSPDAGLPLLELETNKVYCIGGIVDRTVKKGLTLEYAGSNGMVARRLPVQEHAAELGLLHGKCKCPVLNVNDVVVALVEFNRTGDWVLALEAAIPERKKWASGGASQQGMPKKTQEWTQQCIPAEADTDTVMLLEHQQGQQR